MATSELEASLRRTRRVAALLAGVALASSGLAAFLWTARPPAEKPSIQELLADADFRADAIDRIVELGQGLWDSHNDPDVGRVLQPRLSSRESFDTVVSSNRFGLREREYALPKPPGTTRVVLLGDSLVFGIGVLAEERMGALLEKELAERAGAAGKVEVLHIGVGSWDIAAETAYLRRQLSLMQPDLVVHLTTANDLNDSSGVRGMGTKSSFSPRRRARADSRVLVTAPNVYRGVLGSNHLNLGADHESRSRYEEARLAIEGLAAKVEEQGGRYVLWGHWGLVNSVAHRLLATNLAPEQVLYCSREFAEERAYWVNAGDPHWNPRGMERMARLLYGAIRTRGLLPALELGEWDEAAEVLAEEHERELAGFERAPSLAELMEHAPVDARFDALGPESDSVGHLNGGLDAEGRVSPYASFLLANVPGGRLRLVGRALERPELDGCRVSVRVGGEEVGSLFPTAGEPIEGSWPLPESLSAQGFVTVALVADDYVYVGPELGHCVVFVLESLAIEGP